MGTDGADTAAGPLGPAAVPAPTEPAVPAPQDALPGGVSSPRESARPGIARREVVLLLVAAAALQTLAWAIVVIVVRTWFHRYWDVTIPDVEHYVEVAWAFRHGSWPYSQTPFEYPPLTLVPLLIPPDLLPFARYALEFKIEMVVVFALGAVATTWAAVKLWSSSRRALAAAVVLAATVPATGLIGLNRFDATVGLVIALTVLCLAYRRWALAALFVGLGFSLKLMPIVLLPLVFVLARRWRAVWSAGLAALAGMVVPFVPFLIQGGSSIFTTTVSTQTARGLQIETVAASPFLLRQLVSPGTVRVVAPPGGSLSIVARGAGQVDTLAPLLVLALVLIVYLVIWDVRDRLRATSEAIPVAVLALMVATMCGNKVLSPQHLIWVLPVVALAMVATRWSLRIPALLMFVAMILTQVDYPQMYFDLYLLKPAAIIVVAARNLVLLAVLATSLVALWRLRDERSAAARRGVVVS
ncbi:MAG TPA: glycosyltransferase family 87 protein [Thermoleophilia bacterium]|nr:glycosyltransferase family 87 protein [Thermoleophilia bacterium]